MSEVRPCKCEVKEKCALTSTYMQGKHPSKEVKSQCHQEGIQDNQSIDMNALQNEIKEVLSATVKDKLHSEVDSITTVTYSMSALGNNAQYWSDLSSKAPCWSHRALEAQLKDTEEKVHNLLYDEAPEEMLLAAAQEVRNICFQLDQTSQLHEAGLAPDQQVRFRTDTEGNANNLSRMLRINNSNKMHTARVNAEHK